MTNSGAGFDSAMGYEINPYLVENQVRGFSFAPNLPQRIKKATNSSPYTHSKFSFPAPISKWHLAMPRSMGA